MLFNSFEFLFLFFPLVFLLFRFFVSKNYTLAIALLVVSSLLFYGWWNPQYLFLIVGSIIGNYLFARLLHTAQPVSKSKKGILAIGIILNLSLLGYFKYCNFFIENMNTLFGLHGTARHIVLPLAISFFTFQQITYLVDTYKGSISSHNFLYYTLYVTFFPQLIAGPIVHHKEVLPQFVTRKPAHFSFDDVAHGIIIFVVGLSKKVILADSLALSANPIFETATRSTLCFAESWVGALSYSLQLYFDFSGYSDMAIGIALMFGIVLPLNFKAPYKAKSIIEFWRCWHITLSRFLRDYLYIPLGGNRGGAFKRYRNLCITMLLGGLWHGAGWSFIMWGALHGFYLCVNHLWIYLKKRMGLGEETTVVGCVCGQLLTFGAVVVGWVFFRSASVGSALQMLKSMVGLHGIDGTFSTTISKPSLVVILVALGIVWTCPTVYDFLKVARIHYDGSKRPMQFSFLKVAVVVFAAIISLLFLLTIQKPEFLYYDF